MSNGKQMTVAELTRLRMEQLRDSIEEDKRCLEAARAVRGPEAGRAYWIAFFSQRVEYPMQVLGWYAYISGKAVTAEDNFYARN